MSNQDYILWHTLGRLFFCLLLIAAGVGFGLKFAKKEQGKRFNFIPLLVSFGLVALSISGGRSMAESMRASDTNPKMVVEVRSGALVADLPKSITKEQIEKLQRITEAGLAKGMRSKGLPSNVISAANVEYRNGKTIIRSVSTVRGLITIISYEGVKNGRDTIVTCTTPVGSKEQYGGSKCEATVNNTFGLLS